MPEEYESLRQGARSEKQQNLDNLLQILTLEEKCQQRVVNKEETNALVAFNCRKLSSESRGNVVEKTRTF